MKQSREALVLQKMDDFFQATAMILRALSVSQEPGLC